MSAELCAACGVTPAQLRGSHGDLGNQLRVGKRDKSHPWYLRKGRSNTVFKPGMVQQAGGAVKMQFRSRKPAANHLPWVI